MKSFVVGYARTTVVGPGSESARSDITRIKLVLDEKTTSFGRRHLCLEGRAGRVAFASLLCTRFKQVFAIKRIF